MDKPEQFQCQSKPAKLAIFAGKARLKSRELPISGEEGIERRRLNDGSGAPVLVPARPAAVPALGQPALAAAVPRSEGLPRRVL
jgi:hypothetical protein